MTFRTDAHNNPTAFTTDLAKEGHLQLDVDYDQGQCFTSDGHTYFTAQLLGDPVAITIKLIDSTGFYTNLGQIRWVHTGIPFKIWQSLTYDQKVFVIGHMYQHEGGTAMRPLFPQWGGALGVHVGDQVKTSDKIG